MSKYLKNNDDVDIVFGFPPEYLKGLIESNSVEKLDKHIDSNVMENLAPAIMEPIKQAGNGDVYAVTPTFNSYTLAYNKNIFKEIGVKKPVSGMNWEDVYTLSQEIQSKSNYKGVSLGLPSSDEEFYYLYQIISRPIYSIQENNNEISINNTVNQKYWSLFSKIYIDNERANDKEFLKGNVGMAILPVANLMDKELFQTFAAQDLKIEIVEMPIFSENEGGLAYSDSLFAISSKSKNIEAAASFLEYIQGKEFATYLSSGSLLPSYWDNEIKDSFIEKYNFDPTPIYQQR
ncbi:MAG: ABC transporter substrate-binding protein [Thermoanaerobacterium sp.]|nr:ABC transporter substrate-binding protein [Thermoanaerobacterium sp.]